MYFSLLTAIVCLKQSTKIIDLYLIKKSFVLIHCYTKHFINLIHSLWYQYQYILLLHSFLPLAYIFFPRHSKLDTNLKLSRCKDRNPTLRYYCLTTNKFQTTTRIFLAIHKYENMLLFSKLNGEFFYYSNSTHTFDA